MVMKKEWLLLIVTVVVTILLALGLIRVFAPQLLGVSADLRMVQVSEEVVPFYENIFREEDLRSDDFLLQDPYTNIRAKPLFSNPFRYEGPHDILGFRNRSVPNIADIITIGDSNTYGVNAALEENWPGQLARHLDEKSPLLYNMSTGGWGAVQYLDMFAKALHFKPRVVIVAFYTGNDALESTLLAYNADQWRSLRPDRDLSVSTIPGGKDLWADTWEARFDDGVTTTFTPELRLASNRDVGYIRAGYAIMAAVAERIDSMAAESETPVIFTIIPTKEMVYTEKVAAQGIEAPQGYNDLITAEKRNITTLAAALAALPNAIYVDLVAPLQKAALKAVPLYLPLPNGHPLPAGYGEIARALSPAVDRYLPRKPEGLLMVGKEEKIILVREGGIYLFNAPELVTANGWRAADVQAVSLRDIIDLPLRDVIKTVDPARYGPGAFPAR